MPGRETTSHHHTRLEYERLVTDYWILNLEERTLEVYRAPLPDVSSPYGRRYSRCEIHDASARVSPLAAPRVSIRVGDLLPGSPPR